jgi:hypothetical protein
VSFLRPGAGPTVFLYIGKKVGRCIKVKSNPSSRRSSTNLDVTKADQLLESGTVAGNILLLAPELL